jgi:hypothetical protein
MKPIIHQTSAAECHETQHYTCPIKRLIIGQRTSRLGLLHLARRWPGDPSRPASSVGLSVIVDNAVAEDADVQQNHHYGGEMGSRFSSHRVFESFRTRK